MADEIEKGLIFKSASVEVQTADEAEMKKRAAQFGPRPSQVNQPLPDEDIPTDSLCYLFTDTLRARQEAAAAA